MMKYNKTANQLQPYILIFAISLVVSLLLFSNIFRLNPGPQKSIDLASVQTEGDIDIQEGAILISGEGGNVFIDNLNQESKTVSLYFKSSEKQQFPGTGELYIDDDASDGELQYAGEFLASPAGRYNSVICKLESKGQLNSFRIDFSAPNYDYSLVKLVVNEKQSFAMNTPLFLLLFLILSLIYSISKYKWHKTTFDNNSKKHLVIVISIALLCICLSLYIMKTLHNTRYLIPYPFTDDTKNLNIYFHQFDAFKHGQAALRIKPSPELIALENPYTVMNRENIPKLWDYAFYKGRYFSYFGVAPLIFVYYPIYFLTGSLPSDIVVTTAFSIVFIIFFIAAIREMVIKFNIKANLILYILANIAGVFGSLIYLVQSSADRYYIAQISAMTFYVAFVFFAFRAVRAVKSWSRILLFLSAAICFVSVIASRPNVALVAALSVFPLFISVLLNKDASILQKVRDSMVFLVPVLIGGGILLYYNFIRFGSLFEFGSSYQLTVSDIRYNTINPNLHSMWNMFYSYYLTPINQSPSFPFFGFTLLSHTNFGNYMFSDYTIGILQIPICWAILLIGKIKQRKSLKAYTYLSIIIGCIMLSTINYFLGGIIIRYICDILPAFIFVSVLVFLEVFSSERVKPGGTLYKAACLCCILTILIGFMLIFSNERNYILDLSTDTYIRISRIFSIG